MSHTPVEVAVEATGDDTITAAGRFETKGATGKMFGGALLGSFAGDALGGAAGDTIGTVLGATAGSMAAGKDGIYQFLIAVSPRKVYVMEPTRGTTPGGQAQDIRKGEVRLVQTLDREHLEITVKARVNVRTLELEDLRTGEKVGFEGNRIGWSHSKEVIKALVTHDHEADENQVGSAT